jgi:hypothetical protein
LEFANFIIIMIVVMFAFGVTTQALLYPNQDLTAVLFGNVILPGLFIMAGDNIIKDRIMNGIYGLTSKNKNKYIYYRILPLLQHQGGATIWCSYLNFFSSGFIILFNMPPWWSISSKKYFFPHFLEILKAFFL